ncbi:MAG: hypothetical protein OXH36_05580 [Bdellovibrionales bacterium]|nr:hypothetical protein [Bdellovibrionales bacterium]
MIWPPFGVRFSMNKNLLYVLLVIALLVGVSFYFFQSDEKYIKKTTVTLLKLATPSSSPLSTPAILKRVNAMSKYIHFSVQYEIHINGHIYQDSSLADLRSSMLIYFRKSTNNKWRVDLPAKQEINVKIDSSEEIPIVSENSGFKGSVAKSKESKSYETVIPDGYRKTAKATFNIKVAKEGKKASCNAILNWKKEKKWLIHKIKVFNCNLAH